MLPFVKLRSGGRTRRFEVLPSGTARELRDPAVLDSLAVQRLLAWLGAHRAAWTVEPASFTLNLSIATLEDDGFLKQVAAGLQSNGIAPDTVGFEIAEPLCTQRRAQVERFIAGCDKLGCFVVIDDFSFDSAVVPLLRSKALRLVKIDARLTGARSARQAVPGDGGGGRPGGEGAGHALRGAAGGLAGGAAVADRRRLRLRPGPDAGRGSSRWKSSSGRLPEASEAASAGFTLIFPGNSF